MGLITDNKSYFYQEDVDAKSSIAETLFAKMGAQTNFLNNRMFLKYEMGLTNNYSTLAAGYPYDFVGSTEVIKGNQKVRDIVFFHGTTGSSGTTQWMLQVFRSGSWQNCFSTPLSITTSAASNITFNLTGSAPTGVTLPVFASGFDSLANGESIRTRIVSAQTNAQTLHINIYTTQEN